MKSFQAKNLLKSIYFKDIQFTEIIQLLDCLQPIERHYLSEEIIAFKHDPLPGMGIILEGIVSVEKETLSGNRMVMGRFKSGDSIGEMAAFAGQKEWPASVIAQSECTILFIPIERLMFSCGTQCTGHQRLILNALEHIAKRSLIFKNRLETLGQGSIRSRISRYLLDLSADQEKLELNLPLNREQWADYLLITRPSLSRELSALRDEGVLIFQRSSIQILDMERLETFTRS
ncbi:MAG: Crp/Fnr family transcriptional regulator [Anaerolineaceae bacterium]|nr:Crp/Fnr family transcriptional regulator [Anaerolineaceae bacterium]